MEPFSLMKSYGPARSKMSNVYNNLTGSVEYETRRLLKAVLGNL